MVSFQDAALIGKKEVTYKTGVTGDRSFEFVDESLGWDKNIKQGQGLRAGTRVARSARRVVPTAEGKGDWSLEAISKGMGYLWEWCLGSGTSTLVSGSTFQQVFTLSDTPPSWTFQEQLPELGGTLDAYTFLGCMIDKWEFNCPNGDIASLKMSLDIGDLTTATGAFTNAYPASASLFHFANGSISNGVLTSPTSTALASSTTSIASVRSFNVAVNNNLSDDRYNLGGAGRKDKPTPGLRDISGSIVVEYTNTTFRDAVLNETAMPLVLNLVTATALSTGVETLQLVLPEVKFDGELPKANGTDLITVPLQFTVLDNLTAAQPIWVVTRTADTAL